MRIETKKNKRIVLLLNNYSSERDAQNPQKDESGHYLQVQPYYKV